VFGLCQNNWEQEVKLENRHEPITEINVVPLVDIVLVILIIFMVSAPLFIKPSISVNLPEATTGKETKLSTLNVTLSANGKMDLNGVIVSITELRSQVAQQVKKDAEIQAVIAADKAVPHGDVINVLDKLQLAGVKKFAINVKGE
jgi:biopolymer transport protein ExbD